MTPEEIKTLSVKILEQEHVIALHLDQPEESKSDQLWSIVQSYNVAYLHGLRWARQTLIERAEEKANQEKNLTE